MHSEQWICRDDCMKIDENISFNKVLEVLKGTSSFSIKSVNEFNKGIDHILNLIKDAYLLYKNGSYPSAYYLSIIIIEEVAKIHMGLFITHNEKGKRDKLYDHKTKDIIGCNYTVSMGSRLVDAIGEGEIERIYNEAYNGIMKDNRENAFYCLRKDGEFIIPTDMYKKKETRSILLFAIESFDDNLVGYTDYSMEKSKETDEFFEQIQMDL